MSSLRGRDNPNTFYGLLSNYCGLGGEGIPQHRVDQICKIHDEEYDRIKAKGYNPYTKYNSADRRMKKRLMKIVPKDMKEYVSQKLGEFFLYVKEHVAEEIDDQVESEYNDYDIGEIVPETQLESDDSMDVAIGISNAFKSGTKRSLSNLPPSAKRMKKEEDEPMPGPEEPPTAAARSAGGSNGGGSQETPIMKVQPTYGLQETHTTILPYTMYFSFGNVDYTTPIVFKLRMNTIFGILATTLNNAPGTGTTPKALLNKYHFNSDASGISTTDPPFTTPQGGNIVPAWREYWTTWYDAYTVMAHHWKLTIRSASNTQNSNGDGMCVYGYDGTGPTYQYEIPQEATLHDSFSWKNVHHKVLTAYTANDPDIGTTVVSGSWYPNMVKTGVQTDQDAKRWCRTKSSESPAISEFAKFLFYKGPIAAAPNDRIKFNVQVQGKLVVQFKDLSDQARYPNFAQASGLVATLPGDALNFNV